MVEPKEWSDTQNDLFQSLRGKSLISHNIAKRIECFPLCSMDDVHEDRKCPIRPPVSALAHGSVLITKSYSKLTREKQPFLLNSFSLCKSLTSLDQENAVDARYPGLLCLKMSLKALQRNAGQILKSQRVSMDQSLVLQRYELMGLTSTYGEVSNDRSKNYFSPYFLVNQIETSSDLC